MIIESKTVSLVSDPIDLFWCPKAGFGNSLSKLRGNSPCSNIRVLHSNVRRPIAGRSKMFWWLQHNGIGTPDIENWQQSQLLWTLIAYFTEVLNAFSVCLKHVFRPELHNQSINQSINQSELLLRQYPRRRPGSVAHQTNQCPKAEVQDSIQKRQQSIGCAGIYGGKAKSKRCVFRRLLKVAVEGADQTKRGSLFHRSGPQERKPLAPVLVLTLGTEKWIPLLDLSGWGGINGVSKAFKYSGWFSVKVL